MATDDSSNLNPENNLSSTLNHENNMRFELNPENVVKLKPSIAALCEFQLNPDVAIAMVDVTEKGFEITVNNIITDAVGHLFLDASWLINFHCNTPIVGKMINLSRLYEFLQNATTTDDPLPVVHVHLDELFDYLTFSFGNDPGNELIVEFMENNAEFMKFPDIKISIETVLETNFLRDMIDRVMLTGGYRLVSMQIKHEVKVSSGVESPQGLETVRSTSEQEYRAWFELDRLASMMEASFMTHRFHLCLLTEPSESIMFRFNLQNFGDLGFIQKATIFTEDSFFPSLTDGTTAV